MIRCLHKSVLSIHQIFFYNIQYSLAIFSNFGNYLYRKNCIIIHNTIDNNQEYGCGGDVVVIIYLLLELITLFNPEQKSSCKG